MQPYLLVPLAALASNAMLVGALLARGAVHRSHRLAALLVAGALWWSLCEVAWNTAGDPQTALAWVRLSALGWVALGPLGLGFLLEATGGEAPRTRRALPALFGVSAGFALLTLTTSWMHTGVEARSWGYVYSFGPAYPFFYAFTLGCLLRGLAFPLGRARRSPHPAERRQACILLVGIAGPLTVASTSDGLLPYFGVQIPHVGTLSFALLGVAVVWGLRRYGHSLLLPGNFAGEILETLSDGVALLRLDGRVRVANPALARLAGTERSALEGAPASAILPAEALAPTGDGSAVETRLVSAGGESRPVAVSGAPLLDRQREEIGRVLVVRDLREVAALRSRLVTAGRLAAVGELAAGIAHEINNPAAYVRANLSVLRGHWEALAARAEAGGDAPPAKPAPGGAELPKLVAEGHELVDEALEGIDRVASIVRDVRGFSERRGGSRERIALPELLDTVLRVTAPKLRYRSRVERELETVPTICGAPQELQQVFTNLLLNAGEAIREGGTIRVRTERGAEGEAVVSVEDDGCGIAPEHLDRIFDPFFTTRPGAAGAGLGLAISHQIVEQHGGEIAAESTPGRGTRIRVRLPAA